MWISRFPNSNNTFLYNSLFTFLLLYFRCRLRAKKWKDPGKIYLDSQSFQELQFVSNWEMFLQELDEPENVTSATQVTVILKRFSITGRSIDDFHEITIQSTSFNELKEAVSS